MAVALLAALGSGQAVQAQGNPESLLSGELFRIDRTHSLLDFTAWHVGFSRVRGTFKSYNAALYFVENDILQSSVSVWIDVESVDTSSPGRDGQLRKEFFNVEKFPLIHFHSERVEADGTGYILIGPLTIRDVTREVRIPFQVATPKGRDQFGHTRVTFTGGLTLNRKDYGVIYANNSFWDGIASEEIKIDIDLSVVVQNFLDSVFPRWRTENSIGKLALQWIDEEGIEAAVARVRTAWKERREEYDFRPSQLLRAGQMLSQNGKLREAIKVLETAREIHNGLNDPEESEYRSMLLSVLGETYARAGDRKHAVQALEEARSLNPKNLRAIELLRRL